MQTHEELFHISLPPKTMISNTSKFTTTPEVQWRAYHNSQ